MTVQAGIFVCPGDVTRPFKENLAVLDGSNDQKHIVKLVIPKEHRMKFLRQLYDANISRTTLFPGLEGFSQSLGIYHHWCEPHRIESSPFSDETLGDDVWD